MSIRERVVTDLGVLRSGPVVTPSALGTLDVVIEDVAAPAATRVSCDAYMPPTYCIGSGDVHALARFRPGSSLVIASSWNRLRFGWGQEIIIEIFPADDGALHARVFGAQTYFFEGRTELPAVCSLTGAMAELTGVVRLAPGAFDDPSLAHGTIEADGIEFGLPVHLSVAF